MRLIDADKLLDDVIELLKVEKRYGYLDWRDIREVIMRQPTVDLYEDDLK